MPLRLLSFLLCLSISVAIATAPGWAQTPPAEDPWILVHDPSSPWARRLLVHWRQLEVEGVRVVPLTEMPAEGAAGAPRLQRRSVLAFGDAVRAHVRSTPGWRAALTVGGDSSGASASAATLPKPSLSWRIAGVVGARWAAGLGLGPRVAVLHWGSQTDPWSKRGFEPLIVRDEGEPRALLARLAPQIDWIAIGGAEAALPGRVEAWLAAARERRIAVLCASPWGVRRGATFGLEPDFGLAAACIEAWRRKGVAPGASRSIPARRIIDRTALRECGLQLPLRALLTADLVVVGGGPSRALR